MYRFLYFLFSAGLLFFSSPILAQNLPSAQAGAFSPFVRPAKKTNTVDVFLQALQTQVFARRSDMTVAQLEEQLYHTGKVDGHIFTAILSDREYLYSLSLEEVTSLAYMAPFVSSSKENPYSHWEKALLERICSQLGDYNTQAPDFAEKSLYAAIAVSLGHHPYLGRQIEDWAFKQMKSASERLDSARRGWAAVVLSDLALEMEGESWPVSRRESFERRLEKAIKDFDWLQDMPTDYTLRGVKNVLGASNQITLIQLFAQANSFFAMQDDDGFLKQMVSAGGLNPVGRAIISDEENAPGRFSSTGESFYLHSPTPGTDGKGHFVDSVNGRRHFILSTLIQALFFSYHMRETTQSSELMQQFIRGYLQADAQRHFVHYLYIPLQAMRFGMVLHDTSSLYGWEREEAALQKELYLTLRKGYPWKVVCTGVQGACEVTAEWMALGKVFSWVGRGIGSGAKAVGRQVTKTLSPRALLYLGVGQVAAKQGGKAVMRWGRQSIRAILQQSGWKGAALVGAGAALQSDSRRPELYPAW